MDRHEVAEFADNGSPDLVLPVYYNTFEAIEIDTDAFKEYIETSGTTVQLF